MKIIFKNSTLNFYKNSDSKWKSASYIIEKPNVFLTTEELKVGKIYKVCYEEEYFEGGYSIFSSALSTYVTSGLKLNESVTFRTLEGAGILSVKSNTVPMKFHYEIVDEFDLIKQNMDITTTIKLEQQGVITRLPEIKEGKTYIIKLVPSYDGQLGIYGASGLLYRNENAIANNVYTYEWTAESDDAFSKLSLRSWVANTSIQWSINEK